MDEGSKLVTQSGATLEQIVGAVKKVTDIVAEIAAASNEQSAGIEQVNKAVMQLDELTQQNAALVEQASAASQAMAEQARDLNSSMARYQVNDSCGRAAARRTNGFCRARQRRRRATQGDQALDRKPGPRLPRSLSLVRPRASPTAPTTRNGRSSEARASGVLRIVDSHLGGISGSWMPHKRGIAMPFPRRLQCVVLLAGALQALNPIVSVGAEAPHVTGRPRVGLVLAGGGAKGGAHVGVLKVLEELHVPIDCIAGTSMGALIGGGYAAGIPADELEKFLVNIDWKKVVGSQGRRDLEPIEQKRSGPTYSNEFEFGITPNGVVAPGGLINTSNIEDLLRVYVARARLETDFNKLPIPYRAVATDMVSSKMVVLDQGDLATAMRASMAIPGGFAPVVMDDMILSDGGLVRNIPIDIARNLCADQVIVVNLVEPEADPVKLQSATQLLARSMDVMIIANEELQLASLRPGDVRIDVIMGDIGTADFERVPDTVPLGVTAARQMSDALSKFSVPEPQYVAWRTGVTQSQKMDGTLAGVRYEGLERVNPDFLAHRQKVQAGDPVDIVTISAEAQRISALQDFDSVSYRLDGNRESPTLTWLPQEKKFGPNYLKVDIGAYASREGDVTFALYGRHVRTWVNSLGAQWFNELQLGGESLLTTGFYQPLDVARRFFIEPRINFSRSLEDVFVDNERVARYDF